jgi:hypothetical protein
LKFLSTARIRRLVVVKSVGLKEEEEEDRRKVEYEVLMKEGL